jgi:transposase
MTQKGILDLFCDGCPWYEPNWDYPCEITALPCVREFVCKGNAKKVELLLEGKTQPPAEWSSEWNSL